MTDIFAQYQPIDPGLVKAILLEDDNLEAIARHFHGKVETHQEVGAFNWVHIPTLNGVLQFHTGEYLIWQQSADPTEQPNIFAMTPEDFEHKYTRQGFM